jgi:hypothetical protein
MNLKNKNSETRGIRAVLILEMVGRPASHLTETMEKIIQEMEKEKGVEIISKEIKEPVEIKENKEFFSTFCEIEVEVKEIAYLAILLFKYMPAHIEILEPELIALTNNGWGDILNEIARRLHSYDEVARILQFRNAELERKLSELTSKEEVKK